VKLLFVQSILFLSFHSFLFAQQIISYDTTNSGIPDNTVRALTKAADGSLWVGTDFGLAHLKNSLWTVYQTTNSQLPDDCIRSIAEDNEGNIWIGTFVGGLAVLRDTGIHVFNTSNSPLPSNHVRAIAFDSAGAWIGTTFGLAYLKDTTWEVFNTTNSPLLSNNITSIHLDTMNRVWAGTINGGLARVEEKGWIIYRNSNSGIPDNSVLDLAHDADNNLWMVTPTGGVAAYNGNTWLTFNIANSNSPTNSYNGIALAPDDRKYFSTIANGLVIYNGNNNWENYTVANSTLPQDELLCIEMGDSTCVWMGTQNSGLVRFCETDTSVNIAERKDWSYFISNPVSSTLNINFLSLSISRIELNLYDLSGRNRITFHSTGNAIAIPLSGIEQGIYLLEIKVEGKREIVKVLVVNSK